MDKEKKFENLSKLLHRNEWETKYYHNGERFDLKELVAVRMDKTKFSNSYNGKLYPSPVRPTIHFSLNHIVENHMYGTWDDRDMAYIIPFKELLEKNKKNFIGGLTVDLFFCGAIELPKNYWIVKKNGENPKEFKEKIEKEIENRGFLVVPGGMWSLGGSGDYALKELFKNLGPYLVEPHSSSVFGITGIRINALVKELILNDNLYIKNLPKSTVKRYNSEGLLTKKELEQAIKRDLLRNPDITVPLINDEYKEIQKEINGSVFRALWKEVFEQTRKDILNSKIPREYSIHPGDLRTRKIYEGYLKRLRPFFEEWINNYPKIKETTTSS